MIIPDSKSYFELSNAIDKAIYVSFNDFSKSEPQLIANLVWNLPKKVNETELSSHFSVKCGGVFVHGQPLVECPDFPDPTPKSVEIGDLLLIRTEIKRGILEDRRAMILQAKKIDSFPSNPDNANQHHLYAHWPRFKYVRSGKLTGKFRSVTGIDLYNGAKYLMLTECSVCFPCACDFNFCSITSHPTIPQLSHHQSFKKELISFILGDTGKNFKSPSPKSNGWDRVIKDLLDETSRRYSVFMKRASKKSHKVQRGIQLMFFSGEPAQGGGLHNFILETEDQEPPTNIGENWIEGNDEFSGISTIEFVINTE